MVLGLHVLPRGAIEDEESLERVEDGEQVLEDNVCASNGEEREGPGESEQDHDTGRSL